MNFCAAPALQSSEATHAEPGVQALIKSVDAHLNDEPKALPRVHTEGTLPHEGIYDQSAEALNDMELMRNAALAWRVTNQSRYLALVDRFLSTWVNTYRPSFNPIDETRFESLILAYDMTASALPVKTRNAAAAFIAALGNGYVQQIDAQKRPLKGTWRNNWQSHRIKLIALAAFTLGDRRMMNAAQRLFVEHLADNIEPDGTTYDFLERDALHYAVYDLQPLATAAPPRGASTATGCASARRTARRSPPRSTGSRRTRAARRRTRSSSTRPCRSTRSAARRACPAIPACGSRRTRPSCSISPRAWTAATRASPNNCRRCRRRGWLRACLCRRGDPPIHPVTQETKWQSACSIFSKSVSALRARIRSGRCAPH